MCLEIRNQFQQPNIAEMNIDCYKIFQLSSDNKTLVSPYRFKRYKIGRLYKIPFIRLKWEKDKLKNLFESVINRGFHSFKNIPTAITLLSNTDITEYVIYKCIIPAGALYYDGKYFSNYDSYASEKIIIVEKVIIDNCNTLPEIIEN